MGFFEKASSVIKTAEKASNSFQKNTLEYGARKFASMAYETDDPERRKVFLDASKEAREKAERF